MFPDRAETRLRRIAALAALIDWSVDKAEEGDHTPYLSVEFPITGMSMLVTPVGLHYGLTIIYEYGPMVELHDLTEPQLVSQLLLRQA